VREKKILHQKQGGGGVDGEKKSHRKGHFSLVRASLSSKKELI